MDGQEGVAGSQRVITTDVHAEEVPVVSGPEDAGQSKEHQNSKVPPEAEIALVLSRKARPFR